MFHKKRKWRRFIKNQFTANDIESVGKMNVERHARHDPFVDCNRAASLSPVESNASPVPGSSSTIDMTLPRRQALQKVGSASDLSSTGGLKPASSSKIDAKLNRIQSLKKVRSASDLSSTRGLKSKGRQGLWETNIIHLPCNENGHVGHEPTRVKRAPESRCTSRKTKRVQFACDKNGHIECRERRVDRVSDPSLWWNCSEMRVIQEACQHIVENAARVLNAEKGEVRGLERHIYSCYNDLIDEHRQLVLDRKDDGYVCDAAARLSKASQRNAERNAMFDTREALKAALSKWDEPVLILD